MTNQEIDFLIENNAIEGVRDPVMLNQAVHAWEWLMEQESLDTGVILKLHKLLMLKDEKLKGYERGYFRDVPVYVGGRRCINHKMVPDLIKAWCGITMTMVEAFNPITLHIAYEKIHPFVDGNGRTGRMLLNWTRLKLTQEPLLIIHEGIEQADYYKWFI